MKKRIIVSLLAGMALLPSVAQVSTTLSPYSQYGLGALSDQSLGFNRGMGGVAYGLRNGKYINMQNPASYSAVDSLTMLFDVGVTGQISNFKEGGKSLNTKTGNFDYAVASFRLLRHVGLALGVVPYSNIGYSYTHTNTIGASTDGAMTKATQSYEGDGGFSQFFLGAGWQMTKNLSIGVNVSYFWGEYFKSIEMSTNESSANVETRTYETSVSRTASLPSSGSWKGSACCVMSTYRSGISRSRPERSAIGMTGKGTCPLPCPAAFSVPAPAPACSRRRKERSRPKSDRIGFVQSCMLFKPFCV